MRASRCLAAAVASAAAAVAFFLGVSPAAAKSFEIAGVQIEATMLPNGDVDVIEHVTYDFDGEFHNGTHPIRPGEPYRLTNMLVTENGRPLPFEGAPYDLAWHFDANDERRTFDISYRIEANTVMGSDVGEFYWQWVGREHPTIGVVQVVLRVPGDGDGVLVWGHGPLNGKVFREGSSVYWEAESLAEGAFVEGRVAVPVALLAEAVPGTTPRLGSILAEEERFADEANRLRQEREERRDRWNGIAVPIAALGWIAFLVVWFRWGKEPPVPELEYVREPPDDPPAVVCALLRFGSVPPLAFAATVVDLAQRGHLEIEEEVEDRFLLSDKRSWSFRRTGDGDELRDWEARILDRLFADGDETTQAEFVKWGRDNAEEAKAFWDSFVSSVKAELDERRYIEKGRVLPFLLALVAAGVVIGLGVRAIAVEALLGIVTVVSGVVQLAFIQIMRRRTRGGAQRTAEWDALRRFLVDFSQLGDAPVEHMELYERYLVYSVALDVSDEVARGLAMRVPQPAGADGRTVGFATWYHAHDRSGPMDFGGLGDFAGFGGTVKSAFVPSQSSGSGGGGGFSGGGGGGGGGGGFGAS